MASESNSFVERPQTPEQIVFAIAGTLILTFVLLTTWVNPNFIWLIAFLGVSLLQSAFTGFCPALIVVNKLIGKSERAQLAWRWIEQNALVIDVRQPDEYRHGHLTEAQNIPLNTLKQEIENRKLNQDQAIVVYCKGGKRAKQASKQLAELGYLRVHNGGGLVEMNKARP